MALTQSLNIGQIRKLQQNPYYTQQSGRHYGGGNIVTRGGTFVLNEGMARGDELAQNYQIREMQLQQAQQDQDLKKQQAATAAQYAQQFLSQWNQSAAETKGIFNTAMATTEEMQPYIDKMSAYGDDINELIASARSDLDTYRQNYSPLESEAIETTRQALGAQRGMMTQLQELSQADYQGVTGRAKADVTQESERGRRAEARRLQGVGLDPSSGRYRGSMRSSQVNEALNKVLASNVARMNEKNRVAGVVQGGLSVVDPSRMGGNIAGQIQAGGMAYNQFIGGLAQTGAGIQQSATGAKLGQAGIQRDLAIGYGDTMMDQYGEGFMSMLGTGMVTDPSYMQNVGVQAGYPLPAKQKAPAPVSANRPMTGIVGSEVPQVGYRFQQA